MELAYPPLDRHRRGGHLGQHLQGSWGTLGRILQDMLPIKPALVFCLAAKGASSSALFRRRQGLQLQALWWTVMVTSLRLVNEHTATEMVRMMRDPLAMDACCVEA